MEYRKITDLLWFREGPGVRNTQYTDSGVKLLNVANLVDGRVDLSTSSRYISAREAYGRYSHFLVDAGDLIVASSGIQVAYFEKKMGFVSAEQLPLCMNTGTIRFKTLDPGKLNIRYFMYYLKSDTFKAQLARQITGAAQLNFGPSHLKRMTVPVCGMEQQERIVTTLDKVYDLQTQLERELELLDTLARSRFAELFGEPERNPGNIPVAALEDVCTDIVDCPHSTPKEYVAHSPYPAIRTTELRSGQIDWTDMKYVTEEEYKARTAKFVPEESDIVYGREGSYGDAVLLPGGYRFCLGQRVMLLRADRAKCDPTFLWFSVRSDYVYRQAKEKNVGATVGHVNVADIKKFRILLPDLQAQQEFAAFLHKIGDVKKDVQQAIQRLDTLKKSLMQRYFG